MSRLFELETVFDIGFEEQEHFVGRDLVMRGRTLGTTREFMSNTQHGPMTSPATTAASS